MMNLTVSYAPADAEVYLLLCSEYDMNRYFPGALERCTAPASIRCTLAQRLSGGRSVVSAVADRADVYRLLMSNCQHASLALAVEGEFLNPNGQQLSTEYIPLPSVLLAAACAWAALLLLWLANWAWHWRVRIRLHRALVLLAAVKLIALSLAALHWRRLAASGFAPASLTRPRYVAQWAAHALLFALVLLVAKGLGVLRARFRSGDVRLLVLAVALATALLLYELESGYWIFATMLLYFLFFRAAFTAVAKNIRRLRIATHLVRQHPDAELSGPVAALLRKRSRALKAVQSMLVAMAMVEVFKIILIVFFMISTPWLEPLLEELLQLGVGLGLFLVFRLRPFSSTGAPTSPLVVPDVPELLFVCSPAAQHPDAAAVAAIAVLEDSPASGLLLSSV